MWKGHVTAKTLGELTKPGHRGVVVPLNDSLAANLDRPSAKKLSLEDKDTITVLTRNTGTHADCMAIAGEL
jgi:hypothetical protein